MTAENMQQMGGPAGLPQPELGDELHPLLKMLLKHIKPLVIGFGAVVLVFGGYGVYDYVQAKNAENSSALLGEIIVGKQGQEKVDALRSFLEQSPGVVTTTALFELASSLQGLDQYEQAVEVWTTLEAAVDANTAPVVKLGKAQAMAQAGRNDDALQLLQQLKTSLPQSYGVEISKCIAETAEKAGKPQVALEAYRALTDAEGVGERTKDYFYYKIAKLEQQIKNNG